jgi:hypothetical protein
MVKNKKKGGEKCLMDMAEDLEEGAGEVDGDLALGEALPPGLILA